MAPFVAAHAAAWLDLLADASVKVALVLAAAALVTLAARRVSAARRHLVWTLALSGRPSPSPRSPSCCRPNGCARWRTCCRLCLSPGRRPPRG